MASASNEEKGVREILNGHHKQVSEHVSE